MIGLTWTSLPSPALRKVPPRCDVTDAPQQQQSCPLSLAPPSPADLPPPSPPPDELVLEWDPSVDVGRSVCQDDVDSSCFSAGAGKKLRPVWGRSVAGGICGCAGRKRRSHLSFLSDIGRPDREPDSVSPRPGSAEGRWRGFILKTSYFLCRGGQVGLTTPTRQRTSGGPLPPQRNRRRSL